MEKSVIPLFPLLLAGNRYTAKYYYCLIELSSKPHKLHNHVLRCSDWPASKKNKYLQKINEEGYVPSIEPVIAVIDLKYLTPKPNYSAYKLGDISPIGPTSLDIESLQ
ncbi:10683_t:CDS:2, partial [Scutellospora calospora]